MKSFKPSQWIRKYRLMAKIQCLKKTIQAHQKAFLCVFIAMIFLVIGCYLIFSIYLSMSSLQAKNEVNPYLSKNDYFRQQFNSFSSQLTAIKKQVSKAKFSKKKSPIDLSPLEHRLKKLNKQIASLSKQNRTSVQNETEYTHNLQAQLKKMEQKLTTLTHATESHPRVVSAKKMPFSVQSIDLIQGHPLVTVRYSHQWVPLRLGEHLAHWVLVKADEEHQSASFKNAKNQYARIQLKTYPKSQEVKVCG